MHNPVTTTGVAIFSHDEHQVVYMDTEGNFRPERVEAIAERFGLDPTETLENVIVTRVFNHEQQIDRAHVRISVSTLACSRMPGTSRLVRRARFPCV